MKVLKVWRRNRVQTVFRKICCHCQMKLLGKTVMLTVVVVGSFIWIDREFDSLHYPRTAVGDSTLLYTDKGKIVWLEGYVLDGCNYVWGGSWYFWPEKPVILICVLYVQAHPSWRTHVVFLFGYVSRHLVVSFWFLLWATCFALAWDYLPLALGYLLLVLVYCLLTLAWGDLFWIWSSSDYLLAFGFGLLDLDLVNLLWLWEAMDYMLLALDYLLLALGYLLWLWTTCFWFYFIWLRGDICHLVVMFWPWFWEVSFIGAHLFSFWRHENERCP